MLEGGGVILTHRGRRSIEVDLGVVRRQLLPCLHLTQHGVMPGKTVGMDTRFGRLVMLLRLQDSCFVQLGRDGRGGVAGKGERLLSEEGVLQGRVRLYPGVWVVLEHAQDQVLELAVVLRGVATLPSSGPRGPACLHPQDVVKGTTSWTPVSFLQTIGLNRKARHGYHWDQYLLCIPKSLQGPGASWTPLKELICSCGLFQKASRGNPQHLHNLAHLVHLQTDRSQDSQHVHTLVAI